MGMLDGGSAFERAVKATVICSTHMAVGPFLMVLNKEILDKVVSTGKSGKTQIITFKLRCATMADTDGGGAAPCHVNH